MTVCDSLSQPSLSTGMFCLIILAATNSSQTTNDSHSVTFMSLLKCFLHTGVKVPCISPMIDVWVCQKPVVMAFTRVSVCCEAWLSNHSISILPFADCSPWPCFLTTAGVALSLYPRGFVVVVFSLLLFMSGHWVQQVPTIWEINSERSGQ